MPGLMMPWIVLSIIGLILLLIAIARYLVLVFVFNPHDPYLDLDSNLRITILCFLPLIFGLVAFTISYYSLIVVWSFR